jgi:NhaA family Na+:H+ antiporter
VGKHTLKHKKVRPINIFNFIFKEERRGSFLMLIAAIAAVIIANGPWASHYFEFLRTQLTLGSVTLDVQHWINEGLMTLFFLVVALEIKREFVNGELTTWRSASFPVIAAIGGMIVPALIFSSLNPYAPHSSGWAIPMATDIAIALGVVGLLGKRIPKSLRVFLLTLATVDDIGSIIVISIFYNHPTNTFALLIALVLALALVLLRKRKFWPLSFLILGSLMWYCLLLAGIPATLAGVIVAFLMPLRTRPNEATLQKSEIIEDILVPITALIIVPLFVFANAGLTLSEVTLGGSDNITVFTGVLLGLLLGKPIGIFFGGWLGHVLRIAQKPKSIKWAHLLSVGFIAGIGFTVSILIADLAYKEPVELQNAAILGILCASLLAGAIGFIFLTISTRKIQA